MLFGMGFGVGKLHYGCCIGGPVLGFESLRLGLALWGLIAEYGIWC